MAEQPWCQSPARPAHGTALRGTAQRGHGQKPHRESSHGPKHVSNSFSSRLRGCTYTHTHSKGPRPKQQSPLGFSFIPWGQEMRICLQLSAKGLHSPAVLSSFQKQSAGTGWQCSPGHQVLSHSRIHSKKKKMKLAFALALQQKEKVTAWVWGMSALPASCRTPQNGPPAPQTKPKQAPKG